jgi:hypothetical protein
MLYPGVYPPDPTLGITDPQMLPPPKLVPRSRSKSKWRSAVASEMLIIQAISAYFTTSARAPTAPAGPGRSP